jgi:hypothetical protein
MATEVQITSNPLVTLSPVLTGLCLSRHSPATADVLAALWLEKQAVSPPNKPNFQPHLTDITSTT